MRAVRYFAVSYLLLTASCLDGPFADPQGYPVLDASEVHGWTIILQSDGGKVWLAQSDTTRPLRTAGAPDSLPASFWITLDGSPAQRNLVLWTFFADRELQWRLDYQGFAVAWGAGPVVTDTRYWIPWSHGRGVLSWDGAAIPVAFDVIGGTPMPTEPVVDPVPAASVPIDAGGLVSLRVDDCAASDSASLRALSDLNLVAEFAVPSRFPGTPGRCTKELVDAIFAAGNAIESHSRFHGRSPTDFTVFYMETVGSARDLAALGYNSHIFIQPGSWNVGDYYFDSPSKLQSPAGALLRRVYVGVEAYAYPQASVAIPVLADIGPAAREIRYFSPAQIEQMVRQAAQGGQWLEFMWHSGVQPVESLTARLSVIAALRDSGLVAVMPYYKALHAVRRGTP